MAFCSNCGHKLNENQKFCTGCGKVLSVTPAAAPPQSQPQPQKLTENKAIETPPVAAPPNFQSTPQPQMNNIPKQKTAVKKKKTWLIALILVFCIIAALGGIFHKQIKGIYYLARFNMEKDIDKKFDYAGQALMNFNITSTYNAFKQTAEELVKKNPDKVEDKLSDIESFVKADDYKKLNVTLYNEKAAKAAEDKKYDAALSNLIKVNKNGGDIKANPQYDAIMLNTAAIVTGSKVYGDKAALSKEAGIVFDNLDEDSFDEIIQIKDLNPNNYWTKEYKITLYKLKNDSYKEVYTQQEEYSEFITGDIYDYDKDKKGLYLLRMASGYVSSAEVYTVKNNSLQSIGTVNSSDFCQVVDFDKDGIFEVKTATLDDPNGNYSHAAAPRLINYYKFKDDGKDPVMVKEEGSKSNTETATTLAPTGDFVFPGSDTRYLTEAEVNALSKDMLGYARNEIFARHGFVFKTDKYTQYFGGKSWYIPNPNYGGDDSTLNDFEKANYKLIEKYEKQ